MRECVSFELFENVEKTRDTNNKSEYDGNPAKYDKPVRDLRVSGVRAACVRVCARAWSARTLRLTLARIHMIAVAKPHTMACAPHLVVAAPWAS